MSVLREIGKRAALTVVLLAFGLCVGAAVVCIGVTLLGWAR